MQPVVLPRVPFPRVLLVALAVAPGACGRPAPATQPPLETPVDTAVELRYLAQPLLEEVELQLTQTSVGQYIEAELRVHAALELTLDGDVLSTRWSLRDVDALTLTGTVAPDESAQTQALLAERGTGLAIADAHGVIDLDATAADPVNVARLAAMSGQAPPAGVLLMALLAEQLRLPRLPTKSLERGETFEIEEESETVIDSGAALLVLPTTTVHRFTLRDIDESSAGSVAELAVVMASIAQLDDDAPEAARIETRTEGTLLFDLDHGAPVSLELSRTETFAVGEVEGERSMSLRARFRNP